MDKKTVAIAVVLLVFFGAFAGIFIWQRQQDRSSDFVMVDTYRLETIENISSGIDYRQFDLNSVIKPNEQNGNFTENVEGKLDVPVLIYEYADYLCSHCAQMNVRLKKLVDDYDGKVAVVFRSYNLDYNGSTGIMATVAADAAALQGYWSAYKDLLFSNQGEWGYLEGEKLQECLENYFTKVSDGKGDLEKFRQDMGSEAVTQKVAFDRGIGKEINIGGTPWLHMNGKWVSNINPNDESKSLSMTEYENLLRKLIDEDLAKDSV